MGGHNMKKIQLTLENVHGGSEILTTKGQEILGELTESKFRHVASRFRTHKTKKKSKLDRRYLQQKREHPTLNFAPGDALDMDIYPSDTSPPYFHVITDHVVDMGWVYGLHSKADGGDNLRDHIRNFYKPFTIFGDAAGEHLGGKWMI